MPYYKLLTVIKHLSLWIILILLLEGGDIVWGWTIDKKHDTFWVQIYGAITNATIFYTMSFYLIPKFYNRQLKKKFFQFSVLLVLVISLLEYVVDYQIGEYYQNRVFLHDKELETWNFVFQEFVYVLPVNLFYYMLAFAYRVPMDRKEMYERELNLQREKLEAELNFLKSQIHPHTLFNGMSSIYHLIDLEPEKAKSLVLNLSNALRYHLYESSDEFTSLSKEMDYLNQYIALNEVRIEEDAEVEIHFDDFEGDPQIAPLLFTAFIENAFKYVSHFSEKEKNKICITMKVEEGILYFECANTFDEMLENPSGSGGIGLENVRSRLQLIYPDTHHLNIKNTDEQFIVELKIPLKETL